MPKLKAIRVINLTYNDQKNIIQDMTLDFHDESSYIYLENGGGKSVLIQLICGMFLSDVRDRDFNPKNTKAKNKKRYFKDLLSTSTPTVLICQFDKDNGKESFIVGMIGCHADIQTSDYYLYSFIHEFPDQNDHLKDYQILDQKERKIRLEETKKYFRDKRKNTNLDFYNLFYSEDRKKYFERLKSLKINPNEWKLLRDICQQESGMSSYIEKYSDDKSLFYDLIFPTVESHIKTYFTKEEQVENIQKIFKSHYRNYKEHEDSIKHLDVYKSYRSVLEEFKDKETDLIQVRNRFKQCELDLVDAKNAVDQYLNRSNEKLEDLRSQKEDLKEQERLIKHEEISFEYDQKKKLQSQIEEEGKSLYSQISKIEEDLSRIKKEKTELKCSGLLLEIKDKEEQISNLQVAIRKMEMSESERNQEIEKLGLEVYASINQKITDLKEILDEQKKARTAVNNKINVSEQEYRDTVQKTANLSSEINLINGKIKNLRAEEKQRQKSVFQSIAAVPQIAKNETLNALNEENKNYEKLEKDLEKYTVELSNTEEEIKTLNDKRIFLQNQQLEFNYNLEKSKKEVSEKESRLSQIILNAKKQNITIDECDLWNPENVLDKIKQKITETQKNLDENKIELAEEQKELERLNSKNPVKIETILEEVCRATCDYQSGYEWIKTQEDSTQLAEKYPIIPFSIIVDTDKDRKAVIDNLEQFTEHMTPILTQEEARNIVLKQIAISTSMAGKFDSELIDLEYLERKKEDLIKSIHKHNQIIEGETDYIDKLKQVRDQIRGVDFTKEDLERENKVVLEIKSQINKTAEEQKKNESLSKKFNDIQKSLKDDVEKLQILLETGKNRINNLSRLQEIYDELIKLEEEISVAKYKHGEWCQKQNEIVILKKKLQDQLEETVTEQSRLRSQYDSWEKNFKNYTQYKNDRHGNSDDAEKLVRRYEELRRKNSEFDQLEEKRTLYHKFLKEVDQKREELADSLASENLKVENIPILFFEERREKEKNLDDLQKEKNSKRQRLFQSKEENAQKLGRVNNAIDSLKEHLTKEGYDGFVPVNKIMHHDFQAEIQKIQETNLKLNNQIDFLKTEKEKLQKPLLQLEEKTKNVFVPEEHKFKITFEDQTSNETGKEIENYISSYQNSESQLRSDFDSIKKFLSISEKSANEFAENLRLLSNQITIENTDEILRITREAIHNIGELIKSSEYDAQLNRDSIKNLSKTISVYAKILDDEIRKIDKFSQIELGGKRRKLLEIKYLRPDLESETTEFRIQSWISGLITQIDNEIQDNNGKETEETIINKITEDNLNGKGIFKHVVIAASELKISVLKVNDINYSMYRWKSMNFSGGEGFVAAFSVFIALCAYARSEGAKSNNQTSMVVIMDNPFGEAQNSNLLQPLMKLMEKVNFQFISFSAINLPNILELFDDFHHLELVQCTEKETGKVKNIMAVDGEKCLIKQMQSRDLHVFKQVSMLE